MTHINSSVWEKKWRDIEHHSSKDGVCPHWAKNIAAQKRLINSFQNNLWREASAFFLPFLSPSPHPLPPPSSLLPLPSSLPPSLSTPFLYPLSPFPLLTLSVYCFLYRKKEKACTGRKE